jgi:hypothetical protein
MILGFIKNYILMFTKLIDLQVGILNGIDQSLVSLQNINSINIMIGIVILGINLIKEIMLMILIMVKFENYL